MKKPDSRTRVRELGQASLEYILMLSIVVTIAVTLKNQLQPLLDGFQERFTAQLDGQLFGNFHRVNVGRATGR